MYSRFFAIWLPASGPRSEGKVNFDAPRNEVYFVARVILEKGASSASPHVTSPQPHRVGMCFSLQVRVRPHPTRPTESSGGMQQSPWHHSVIEDPSVPSDGSPAWNHHAPKSFEGEGLGTDGEAGDEIRPPEDAPAHARSVIVDARDRPSSPGVSPASLGSSSPVKSIRDTLSVLHESSGGTMAVASPRHGTKKPSEECDMLPLSESRLAPNGDDGPGMPEIRRLLSSLDKVDRRVLALEPSGSSEDSALIAGKQGQCGVAGGDGVVSRASPARSGRSGRCCGGGEAPETGKRLVVPPAVVRVRVRHSAARRIQREWRLFWKKLQGARRALATKEAVVRREARRNAAATQIQRAYRRALVRHHAKAAREERRRWEARERRRTAACATLERAWRAFDARRRGKRELAEARARLKASAAVAEGRRLAEFARAAKVIQALVRGVLARVFVRRLRRTRVESHPRERNRVNPAPLTHSSDSMSGKRSVVNPAPCASPPSNFFKERSQGLRRLQSVPDTHHDRNISASGMCQQSISSHHHLPCFPVDTGGTFLNDTAHRGQTTVSSERLGHAPARLAPGATRPARFADVETARIARIMRGNLRHWAGIRSGGEGLSSSDDPDL